MSEYENKRRKNSSEQSGHNGDSNVRQDYKVFGTGAGATLDQDNSMLQGFFDVALDLLCIADTDGNFLKVNRAWEDILGYSVAELENKKFLEFVHPDDYNDTVAAMAELDEQKMVLNFTNRYRCSDGSYRYIEWRSHPQAKLIYAAARDITDRVKMEQSLRENEERNRALINAIPDMLFRYNREGVYVDAQIKDDGMLHPYGRIIYRENGLVGSRVHDVLPAKTADLIIAMIHKAIETGELQIVEYSYRENGELKHFEVRLFAIGKEEAVSIVRDITEEVSNDAELRYLSLHDPLTGLYNRAYFQNELGRLENGREYPVGLISADLDALKLINDTLGHKEGDRYLQECANLLARSLRSSDILARVGGDEFAIVLPQTDQIAAEALVTRIRSEAERYNSTTKQLPLSISLGYTIAVNNSEPLEDMFNTADQDMYSDKLQRSPAARVHIIRALLASLYERNELGEGYNERVQELCVIMGQKAGLDEKRMADLVMLSQVFDLGKATMPRKILDKRGKLTQQEWEIIRRHSEKGYRIALASVDLVGIADYLLRHHENWDGSGYPLGISGEEIPLESRILALANSYCAMTTPRTYSRALSREEALRELQLCAGTQFDPELVKMLAGSL